MAQQIRVGRRVWSVDTIPGSNFWGGSPSYRVVGAGKPGKRSIFTVNVDKRYCTCDPTRAAYNCDHVKAVEKFIEGLP